MDNLVYCLIRHRLISQLVKVQYVYYDIDTVPVATSEEKLSVHLYRSYPSFVIKRFSHTIYMLTNRSTYILIVINHINLI